MRTRHRQWSFHAGAAFCLQLACASSFAATTTVLIIPAAPAWVQQAILHQVEIITPQTAERRRYRMALPFGSPLFPPDADFAATPVTPSLAAWLALPASQRQHDVLITPDADYYWSAEGRQYSCQFLIHIATMSNGSQRTLTQVRPVENAGKHFELLGRTGPGRYWKLLPTSPSPQTDADLRMFLTAAIARQTGSRPQK